MGVLQALQAAVGEQVPCGVLVGAEGGRPVYWDSPQATPDVVGLSTCVLIACVPLLYNKTDSTAEPWQPWSLHDTKRAWDCVICYRPASKHGPHI